MGSGGGVLNEVLLKVVDAEQSRKDRWVCGDCWRVLQGGGGERWRGVAGKAAHVLT